VIEIEYLTKQFGSFWAVDRVSLSVKKGQIYGLLGANGAGKTTLIRMLCGVLKPTSGRGKVLGYELQTEKEKIKPNIGYMSQKFSLYQDLTVEENLLFYAQLYGVKDPKTSVRSLLDQFSLYDIRNRPVASLGLGIRQRVAFTCALVHHPPLLVLDEPTSGVDPMTRRLFWEHLYQLAEQGTTILITTHYMDEAERCSAVAFMNNGKIVVEGKPSNLKKDLMTILNKNTKPSLEDVFIYYLSNRNLIKRE
jgi:ABC-2 type transport system ATP-binding protein